MALACVTPTANHSNRFVVAQEPIRAGAVGRAMIAGDNTKLVNTVDRGAAILWRESLGYWAIIRLGNAAPEGFWAEITGVNIPGTNVYNYTRVDYFGWNGWTVLSSETGQAIKVAGPTPINFPFVTWVSRTAGSGVVSYVFQTQASPAGEANFETGWMWFDLHNTSGYERTLVLSTDDWRGVGIACWNFWTGGAPSEVINYGAYPYPKEVVAIIPGGTVHEIDLSISNWGDFRIGVDLADGHLYAKARIATQHQRIVRCQALANFSGATPTYTVT